MMTLRVSGKNMNIGDALRQHVTERLNGATTKYFDGAITGHVTIAPEGSGFRSDCSLHLTTGTTLQSDGRAQDVYASFEQAADRMEKRLRRYKERLKGRHPQVASTVDGGDQIVSYVLEAPGEEADYPSDGQFSPIVIAEKTTGLVRMTVSAAVYEFDLTGAGAFTFRHDVSGRVNIIYRRPDGNIGWIDIGADERRSSEATARTKSA